VILITTEIIGVMTLLEIAGGFIAGVITGVGISVFYLRWKVKRQLGAMQGQMEDMMDMTEGMEGLGDAVHEEPEDLDELSEEKED
jgi:Flp pilus assembly protein TadB